MEKAAGKLAVFLFSHDRVNRSNLFKICVSFWQKYSTGEAAMG